MSNAVRLIPPTRVDDSYRAKDMLRLITAGSVDDGKSTLIGRLLYDTKSIFEDQLNAVESASRRRGEDHVNLALLTDGLRAEREQNITIDVAYRYFATPRRKFVLADTPGHVQYTRNMVTGASTADLAIVLVDARKGLLEQSKRHTFISSLLGIQHILVAVNKMDLVDYREDVFREIAGEFTDFASKLDVQDLVFIPISALQGDNVVTRSDAMMWYEGSTVLHHLETVSVASDQNFLDFRFPVQYVISSTKDYRGLAGRIASGTIRPGEEVSILPRELVSRVRSVEFAGDQVDEGVAGDSVVLTLEDEIDVSRGDMIVRRGNIPQVGTRLDAMICWMAPTALNRETLYVLVQTTRTVRAVLDRIVYRMNVNTLHRESVDDLQMNDIGRVELTTSSPIFFDPYDKNAVTGSFILLDPFTNETVAAGMIRGAPRATRDTADAVNVTSPNVVWEPWNIHRAEREERNEHQAAVVWLTGLSGSGKSTIARQLERTLYDAGCQTMLLDGDQIRHGLNGDLGFSNADRHENIRRVAHVSRLFFEQGNIVVCALISPFASDRDFARKLIGENFFEVFVDCSFDTLVERDTKGFYRKAQDGELKQFTGISSTYEPAARPELHLNTDRLTAAQALDQIISMLVAKSIIAIEP